MLAFDEATHVYSVAGRRGVVPHVTGVLPRPAGLLRASAYDLEYKRALGAAVHKLIQLDLHGTLPDVIDEELAPWLAAWRDFRTTTGFEPLLVETRMYSEEEDVAGTLDMAGYLRARLSGRKREALEIIDAKCTTAPPPPATALQLAAYQMLVEQNFPTLRVRGRSALWLRPGETPAWRLVPFTDPLDRQHFLCFLDAFKWRRQNGYEVAE